MFISVFLTRKTLSAKRTIQRAHNESVAQGDLTEQKKKILN
jgi:hypothetical protein